MPPIITLLTDFGIEDSYVAEVKGVILSHLPEAVLVDITHLIPPQDILRGALVLANAAVRFPPGTIHCAVVDPGVGTERRAIAAEAGGYVFVGPDNGLLSLAFKRLGAFVADRPDESPPRFPPPANQRRLSDQVKAVHLVDPRFWSPTVSATFHGRDIFAPIAARLAKGLQLEDMGVPIQSVEAFLIPTPKRKDDGSLLGYVMAVDRFGNLITNLESTDLPDRARTQVGGRVIDGLRRT